MQKDLKTDKREEAGRPVMRQLLQSRREQPGLPWCAACAGSQGPVLTGVRAWFTALLSLSSNPSYLLNKGRCLFILHWVLQIMQSVPGETYKGSEPGGGNENRGAAFLMGKTPPTFPAPQSPGCYLRTGAEVAVT